MRNRLLGKVGFLDVKAYVGDDLVVDGEIGFGIKEAE